MHDIINRLFFCAHRAFWSYQLFLTCGVVTGTCACYPTLVVAVSFAISTALSCHISCFSLVSPSLTLVLAMQLMWLLGPRGIPADWRHMEGFGVHTFKMVNKAGKETYVKFHWKPTCGVKVLTDEEAKEVGMANNVQSHATEDLWNSIESGMYPLLKCTSRSNCEQVCTTAFC